MEVVYLTYQERMTELKYHHFAIPPNELMGLSNDHD